MHTEKLRGLALDTAVGFLQTARDPVHTTTHIFRMLRHIEGCQLTKKAFLDLAEQAEYREIIQQRFDPIWPSAEELRSMPPSLNEDGETWTYLANRLRRTHDFHHLILGLPDTVAGEAVASSYYACRYKNPGALAVMSTWLAHGYMEESENDEIWSCVRFGIKLAQDLPISLLAIRWEDAWTRSVSDWRDSLGISEFLSGSPLKDRKDDWLPT
jgi:ubiquinone biosynthesis protein COQ4